MEWISVKQRQVSRLTALLRIRAAQLSDGRPWPLVSLANVNAAGSSGQTKGAEVVSIKSVASGQWINDVGVVTDPGQVAPDVSGSWVELPHTEIAGERQMVYVPVPPRQGGLDTVYVPAMIDNGMWIQAVGVPVLDSVAFNAQVRDRPPISERSPAALDPQYIPQVKDGAVM